MSKLFDLDHKLQLRVWRTSPKSHWGGFGLQHRSFWNLYNFNLERESGKAAWLIYFYMVFLFCFFAVNRSVGGVVSALPLRLYEWKKSLKTLEWPCWKCLPPTSKDFVAEKNMKENRQPTLLTEQGHLNITPCINSMRWQLLWFTTSQNFIIRRF